MTEDDDMQKMRTLFSVVCDISRLHSRLEFEKEEIDGKLVNIADFLAKVSQKATEHKEAIKVV